jgi:hypothetical protein
MPTVDGTEYRSPEFVPVKRFSDFLEMGWKMVEGYPLHAGDFAVLMTPPEVSVNRPKNNKAAGRVSAVVSIITSRTNQCNIVRDKAMAKAKAAFRETEAV